MNACVYGDGVPEDRLKSCVMQELVDTHIFEEAQRVAGALDRHDCGPALEWCRLHCAKLKKTRSLIIFKLRLQVSVRLLQALSETPAATDDRTKFLHPAALAGVRGPGSAQ